MMLTQEQIEQNKKDFIDLLNGIKPYRENFNLDGLVDYLNKCRFFNAPASTKYHCSYEGGLCEHTLDVLRLALDFADKNEQLSRALFKGSDAPRLETSIHIACLLHDISRAACYEEYVQNKKVYSSFGAKSDEIGKFDWVSQKAYKFREAKDRFCYGSFGQESEYIARCFLPLTMEESCAIIHSSDSFDNQGFNADGLSDIYAKHPLLSLLHIADFASMFIIEGNE